MTGMRRVLPILVAVTLAEPLAAQTRKPPVRRPAPAPPAAAMKKAAPEMTCPAPLGVGIRTKLSFCEVLAGRDPSSGVLIKIPPHRGPATLTFDLHNLHLYSEEQIKAKRAFTRYTATIGVMTMDNTLVNRAVVQNEFRAAGDVKAVAPTGAEPIVVSIAEADEQVSLLGEKVTVEGMSGPATTFSQPGRPIAVVSNVMIEYRPAPATRRR
jgi:hypothetical protein